MKQNNMTNKDEFIDLGDFKKRMLTMMEERIKKDAEFRKRVGSVDAATAYPIPEEPPSIDWFNDKILEIMKEEAKREAKAKKHL